MPHDLPVHVMDIGGSHITAALTLGGTVLARAHRDIDPHGSVDEIVGGWAAACLELAGAGAGAASGGAAEAAGASPPTSIAGASWGIAMPDPFDFERGVGTFDNVGKFEQLANVDLRGELARRLDTAPDRIRFVHDAGAYGIGEWVYGEAVGFDRAVCITLGTGVGSSFLDHGVPVKTRGDVPTNGTAHLLSIDGRPLEETVSTRALIAGYERMTGETITVKTIAERSRAGDQRATDLLDSTYFALGSALAPWIDAFDAAVLVAGGSISRSWNILEPPFRAGIAAAYPERAAAISLRASHLLDDAPLLGAAYWLTHP
ncbi:ROK family protein [Subtercola lobariae]|uniref:Glucokinase n=1 Tax=Subtercola lobariae TaxID=1588641 RepID=A0A917B0E0_9MICO|nr:ROK family protein [Subtercola lobariae]GGF12183.1 glucokinase [Subtercola lobariae]